VNAQIGRLFYVLVVLFVSVIGMVTWWLWKAPDLEARRGNPTLIVKQLTIERGTIYAADGRTVFARNREEKRKNLGRIFLRVYPQHELVAHPVGYSTIERSRTGLEKSLNDYLTGSNANLGTLFDNALDKLKGLTQKGNDVVTTISAPAQRLAMQQLAGKCGAAVALDPRTGRVLVLASTPGYDPNLVEGNFNEILRTRAACGNASPLLDRATQGLFIPGSTFKVVTAAASLDTGRYTPSSRFDDPGYCIEYGKKVTNFSDQDGPEVFGHVNFTQAVEHSINAVFCEIGKRLGALRLIEYAKRFGFYGVPPLETPSNERRASGLYQRGKLFSPKHDYQVDPGRFAFGQERLLATPLEMAMVAAAIANGAS